MSSRAAATVSSDQEKDLVSKIKAATPAKAALPEFDVNRTVKWDPRDPRAQVTQWPCYGRHQPGVLSSNRHGQWQHCKVCNLRLLYTPRMGSPASHMQSRNPAMVAKMLEQLEPLMEGKLPTETICLAMMEKIHAEEKLASSIKTVKANKGYKKTSPPEVVETSGNPAQGSPSNSWESVHTQSPEHQFTEDLHTHLNEEELAHLQDMVNQRKANLMDHDLEQS